MSNFTHNIVIPGLENYNGSKGGNGVYQQIISHIPPHRILVIPFLGHCGIIRKIAPADILICGDASEKVINYWKNYMVRYLIYKYRDEGSHYFFYRTNISRGNLPDKIYLFHNDALHFLPNYLPNIITKYTDTPDDVVIYQDPPYPKFTRKSSKDLYDYEMTTIQHENLLSLNVGMLAKYKLIISSYKNKLYNTALDSWNRYSFSVGTRSGGAIETIYYNYDLSDGVLQDYRYLGKNFKDRERIRLKIERWVNGLQKLDARERMAIINQIVKTNL